MVKIKDVISGSPAAKAGISGGDVLISINNNEINDVLDYMFYAADNKLLIKLQNREMLVKKNEYTDLGLVFDSFLMSESRRCKNKCIFCFIDQLPENLRETLYFKDDDSRLSFLQGNYITLTNLTERETERIIKMKLAVNVSVHTTDPDLRCKMLGNPYAGQALEYLYRMAKAGLEINSQIVVCPEINDGTALEKTLGDLTMLYPSVRSIACVPVGLTKFRDKLYPLKPFNEESAKAALDIIGKFGDLMYEKYGERVCFPSDEFFLLANSNLPDYEYYEDFPQYENGVGMLASLEFEFTERLAESGKITSTHKKSLATGVSAAPFINRLVVKSGADITVYAIENNFFGKQVNVAGLITGGDLIKQLVFHKNDLGEELLIPSVMLRAGEDVFLDDVTVNDVENALGVKVRTVGNDGGELFDAFSD